MRKLLEMILEQLKGMVDHITTQLEALPPELSLEQQEWLCIGEQVAKAAANNYKLRSLYASGRDETGATCFVHEDYASMIESLIHWEDEFDGKDRDSVLSVYEVASDADLDDSSDLEDFISKAADAVSLVKRIESDTDFCTDDEDTIIEALTNTCKDWEEVKDAIEKAYYVTRNW